MSTFHFAGSQRLLGCSAWNFALKPVVVMFGAKPLLAFGVGSSTMPAGRAGSPGNSFHSLCSSTPATTLGDRALKFMCANELGCQCAKSNSEFDKSLNTIGATDGYAGSDVLRESRSAELKMFKEILRKDQLDVEAGKRRRLIQVSQCSGMGKTTLLGLLAKEFPSLLAESQHSSQATAEGADARIIGSLVTYNGVETSYVLSDITVEEALCIRVMYGALACHSAHVGHRCPHLKHFEDIAPSVPNVFSQCKINVQNTCQVLWRWFGHHPIFVGIDEALKCKDGKEEDILKLQCLLTAAGAFLDTRSAQNRVYVVLSALSPNRFIKEFFASSRKIENILVFPIERSQGVKILRSYVQALNSDLKVPEDVLEQFEAIAGGHARAIGMAARFIAAYDTPNKLLRWDSAQNSFISFAAYLEASGGYLASCPEPNVLEYLISNPPLIFPAHKNLFLEVGNTKGVDELIFTGQVLITRGPSMKITVASWGLLSVLADFGSSFPTTSLLQKACKLTFDPKNPTSWFEGFCLFFVAEALRRGKETLEITVPHLYEADHSFSVPRDNISIEAMTIPRQQSSKSGPPKLTNQGAEQLQLHQAKLVMERVIELQGICASAGRKCTILVLPPQFTALNAVLVTYNKVIGIQIKSQIDEHKLLDKIVNVRSKLEKWTVESFDLLGPDGLVMYMVGVDSITADLKIMDHERIVTAGQLRDHFLDVFFRYGLTGGESTYS